MRRFVVPFVALALPALGLSQTSPQTIVRLGRAGMGQGCGVQPVGPVTPELAQALKFQQTRVRGRELRSSLKKLTRDVKWHRTLASAARVARQEGKPILWIQALGSLTGHT